MKKSTRDAIEKELPDADYPSFEPGDQIRVETREEIGGVMRRRFFEGVCIARKGEGIDQSFKVRKESFGVGVERIFPLHSPIIESIRIIRKGVVNQSKLNYLADKSSKEARIDERRADLEELNRNTEGEVEDSSPEQPEASETEVSEPEKAEEGESTEEE